MSTEKGMKGTARPRRFRRRFVAVLAAGACLCGWTLQAAGDDDEGFRIKKAEWKSEDRELRVEGDGTRGATVSVEDATSGAVIWPATLPIREDEWKIRIQSLAIVPCRVRAKQSDGSVAERDVENRPRTCGQASLRINDVTVAEGGSASFTVRLSAASTQPVTVVASTANGSAVAPGDYTARSGVTLTFPAGTTTQSFAVATASDAVTEGNETFTVNLSGANGAAIADGRGVGTITNVTSPQSALPTLSIANVSVNEGNSATSTATFTATLSAPAPAGGVTFSFATANGTTNAATAGSDYVAATGTRTINAGATTATFPVTINGDATVEPNETFTVNVTGATNTTNATASATGTIVNDDVAVALPTLSIANVSVNEGNSATSTATFTATLSAPAPAGGVTFSFATANGASNSASAGTDYVAASGSRTIAAGATTATIPVTVNGDTTVEPNETFAVNITGANNTANATASATGTIVNDDQAPAPPPTAAQTSISISDAQAFEGQTATFTVTLSASPSQQVTVSLVTANGTAVSPGDFTARTATVSFSAGTTTLSQTFVVTTTADTAAEPNETFAVNLSNASGASIVRAQGLGTILDNTQANVIAIHDRNSTLNANANCTSCHAGMLTEPSLNTAVRPTTAHGTMLRSGNKPGSSGSNNQCRWCHHTVSILEGPATPANPSEGSLRRQVDSAVCTMCHGPASSRPSGSGGRQLYQVGLSSVVPDTDGATLYDMACSGCHRPLANSEMRGSSASSIQSAITGNRGSMGPLRALTPAQVQAIANALR